MADCGAGCTVGSCGIVGAFRGVSFWIVDSVPHLGQKFTSSVMELPHFLQNFILFPFKIG